MTLSRAHPTITQARRDGLAPISESEVDIARVIEGACAHYHGVPLEANPWPRHSDRPELYAGWRYGWLQASYARDMWEAEEVVRWRLTEEAAEQLEFESER